MLNVRLTNDLYYPYDYLEIYARMEWLSGNLRDSKWIDPI